MLQLKKGGLQFFLYSERPFLHLENFENRAKKGPCKKRAFSSKNEKLTDFSYNSLISDKILDKGFAY